MFFCVHKSANGVLLCIELDFFMYTRVHNGMLCTEEYKAHFIVGIVEAFVIRFCYSHYA